MIRPVALVLLFGVGGVARAASVDVVGLRVNEVTIVTNGVGTRLTHDGQPKSLPVWSPDGKRIAYIVPTKPSVGLAKLIVIARDGTLKMEYPIQPVVDGVPEDGMRFVERVEWIAPDRIAISGSVNPASGITEVVDAVSGRFIRSIIDYGAGVGFSPDGRKAAYVIGPGQFARPDARARLVIDDDSATAFVAPTADTAELTRPVWSADGASVSTLFGRGDSAAAAAAPGSVVLWRQGAVSVIPYTGTPAPGARIVWTGATPAVAVPSAAAPTDDAAATAAARKAGLTELNAWCLSCTLSRPRGVADTNGGQ